MKVSAPTLTSKLVLAGTPCDLFGNDLKTLDLTSCDIRGRVRRRPASELDVHWTPRLFGLLLFVPRDAHPPQNNGRVKRTLRSSCPKAVTRT
jgi:hypothetical protein